MQRSAPAGAIQSGHEICGQCHSHGGMLFQGPPASQVGWPQLFAGALALTLARMPLDSVLSPLGYSVSACWSECQSS